jgi:Ni,Fe-hydrogenase III large subunit
MSVKESTLVNEESAQGVPPQALSAEPIFFTEADDAARSIVRSGEFHRLKDLISRQRRMLMNGESLLTQVSSETSGSNGGRGPNGPASHAGHMPRLSTR